MIVRGKKMSQDLKLKRFGRYLILDHLVDGGMAKICRARFLGEQANKIVAIKMIQQQYSNDPAFVQMFKDELKVTFGLIHPNIAQTYDYGEVENVLYTAMEYVDGKNLKQYLDRLKKRKFVFPVEISTYIISQVSQALHYAHTFTDKLTGKTFNIVHRDVSPHNIMMTYDGAVKVIDFGIAKAETNSEATQAGTIKGKLSYLAPEYLDGLELDHRYDQFAVGITLWEMLCSKKLFSAANDLAVLKKIQACDIPVPSSINPNVPPELDKIVLKALSKERSNRFKNMDALNRALVRFLYSTYPEFNATDLAYFAKELFKEDIFKDRERLKEYGKIDIKPYLSDFDSSHAQKNLYEGIDASTVEALIVTKKENREIDLDLNDQQTGTLSVDLTRTTKRNNFNEIISKENERIQSALSDVPALQRAKTRTRTRVRRAEPIAISHPSYKRPEKKSTGVIRVAMMLTMLAGGGYLSLPYIKSKTSPTKQDRKIATKKSNNDNNIVDIIKANDTKGIIFFENYDPSSNIVINGEQVPFSNLGIKLNLNEKHRIKVSKKNHSPFYYSVLLTSANKTEKITIKDLKYREEGILNSGKVFPPGTILKYRYQNETFNKKMPFSNYIMPAGSHQAIIINKKHKIEKRIMLNIKKDKIHNLR